MKSIYQQLEGIFKQAESFIDTFTKYQALWDIEKMNEKVYETLGDGIDKWNQILNEITVSKWRMSEMTTNFVIIGGLKISYGHVYSSVS